MTVVRRHAGRLLALALLVASGSGSWTAVVRALPGEEVRPISGISGGTTEDVPEGAVTRREMRPVLAGPVDPATYVIGPGDLLSIEFEGRAVGSRPFLVDGEGRARVPGLGTISLAGRTLAAARTEILRHLKPLYPGAILDVRLLQPRTFRVYVVGEVKKPGSVEVVGSTRVLEAIELAGGVSPGASHRNVQVRRRQGALVTADLERFHRTGDWEGNPLLEDGDRIVVPISMGRLGVFGAVARPGFYEFREGDSLGTALRLAGGLLPESRLDSVLIVRFRGANSLDTLYTSVPADLQGGGASLPLERDDRVFVRPQPEWRPARQVTITGEVRAPGTYAIEEGKSRVSDVVRWAGGFTAQASRRSVRLERRAAETAPEDDVEFERLNRLTRPEMTNTEYQTFRSKLAVRQSVYLVDFAAGAPAPPAKDVFLRDGDLVEVGRLELAVRVDGSVRSPGLVSYEEGRSASDYIRLAGGIARRGNAGDARLTRAGTNNTILARDARRVEPGDFIWVPEKKDTSFWSVVKDVFLVAGQAATIILLIDNLSK